MSSQVEVKYTQIFIDGEYVNSASGKTFETKNPATGKVIANIQEGDKEDIDRAVKSARAASDGWANTDPSKRAVVIQKFADLMEKHFDQLVALESLDNGKPVSLSKGDITLAISHFRYYAGWCDKVTGKTMASEGDFFNYTAIEPVGVVGAIIPWNFPILMFTWKVAPALATGNAIVVKPAETTPLTALYLARLLVEAGLPKGVCNVVPGYGHTAGNALSRHMDVDKIAFTGSTRVGKLVQIASGESNLKAVTLELGGKSPLIIMDDAAETDEELEQVVTTAIKVGIFYNQGQVCCASSRVFVHEKIHDRFVEKAVEVAKKRNVGNPFDDATEQGPQQNEVQFNTVLKYIKIGQEEDKATLSVGGQRVGSEGYFVQPTIFTNVTDNMTIAKEEIFGPVVAVLKFGSLEEVIKRANDTSYGLAAGIMTKSLKHALKFSKEAKAGTVWVNCWNSFQSNMPFGGYKMSGFGRDLGEYALNNYTKVKAVHIHIPGYKN
ncbi:aldehyde dehydrogenase [Acrasis kona]|uniref:Aldehyde dehydrogenase n=1 Tax=Acrasis kona TaxID=1008807 RepID=A0AAW2YMY1_9EUKA